MSYVGACFFSWVRESIRSSDSLIDDLMCEAKSVSRYRRSLSLLLGEEGAVSGCRAERVRGRGRREGRNDQLLLLPSNTTTSVTSTGCMLLSHLSLTELHLFSYLIPLLSHLQPPSSMINNNNSCW
jgi:hypothetical protein